MTRARREGFPGQHLVVVPGPVRARALRHPLLRPLLVTDAGYYPRAAGHRVERPQGAATHLLILCAGGAGWVKSAGREVAVSAGDVVWLPADEPHAYGAAAANPWKIFWAHFTGDEVAAWRAELGWAAREPVGHDSFRGLSPGSLGLDKVYASLEAGYSVPHLLAAATALRGVFGTLLEARRGAGHPRSAAERIAALREEMEARPAQAWRLEELAATAGLSVPHFSLLFRRQTGFAPIDFLIRQRLRQACRLLDGSTATIAAVAGEVGFADPYYFSRCFRKIMGTSPRDYRQRIKG